MSSLCHLICSWLICIIADSKQRRTSRIPRCSPLQNGLSFEFKDKFPRRYKLPFCSQYSKSCCRPSDSQRIFNAIKPVLQSDEISSKCKKLTSEIYCSSCSADVGTRKINGICLNYCNEWYNQCRDEYYVFDLANKLQACTANSTVCSPLHSFIANGTDFCEVNGFEINYIYLNCFDGTNKINNGQRKKIKLLNSKKNKNKKEKKKKKSKAKKQSKKQRKLNSLKKKIKAKQSKAKQ